ncbi:MAG: CHAP domain-containing protein [Chitinivibrionales bacterium]|nr:CHAP domain-containing protein [Chitinivibrionales bacterium]
MTDPGPIVEFLDKTGDGPHDYEAWCSEFVCWAYKASGYPLETSSGGWMIGGSSSLRAWFEARDRWVSHTSADWNTFVPATGDYIRYDYNNGAGGHSAIVRDVSADEDTLYTVEGNCGNKVRTYAKTQWRDFSVREIDGFGRMSGFVATVW